MTIINNELNAFVDIDNTLLMWDNPTVPGVGKLELQYADTTVHLTPHTYHVSIVKSYLERGYTVILWSSNGVTHATRAAKALGLDECVNNQNLYAMAKPQKHLDDNPDPNSILGPRVYEQDLTKPASPLAVPYGYLPTESPNIFIKGK
jgi:hypothetical protein